MSMLPVLQIHLDDPETGAVSWRAPGVKGARWKKARSISEASEMADEVIPGPREVDFVLEKD